MQDLNQTLLAYDLEMLRVIANRWDVDLNTRDPQEAAARLVAVMRSPDRVTDAWNRLDDDQRRALQTLLGGGGTMSAALFKRLFGDIRPMGPGKLEREKPYLSPVGLAEALYYRGLIATTLDHSATGTQGFVFVPSDLMPLMPIHQTGYDLTAEPEPLEAVPPPPNVRAADTILVDDLATLLAFCQVYNVGIGETGLIAEARDAIKPHLLGSATTARLALMVSLALDLGIAAEQNGALRPLPTVRRWLELRRTDQVRALTEAWQRSALYNELWYVPGLKPETSAGWANDPLLARQTVLSFLELVPPDAWWPVDELVDEVKENEPDFQRPAGDYDSWYIRDAQTGAYLRGFDSWDRVDGAMLRFILIGPMNGLGLLDTAQNGGLCRLTAYGRAFVGMTDWPSIKTDQPLIRISDDGTIEAPRAASRYDRFQVARFTEWLKAADPFVYRLSAAGLTQAANQKIQSEQILTFLRNATRDAVPESVVAMIETWGLAGDSPATLERLVVLRVSSPDLLNTIQSTPTLRRYLSAPLGPTAVAVRADQVDELVAALQAQGIPVEIVA